MICHSLQCHHCLLSFLLVDNQLCIKFRKHKLQKENRRHKKFARRSKLQLCIFYLYSLTHRSWWITFAWVIDYPYDESKWRPFQLYNIRCQALYWRHTKFIARGWVISRILTTSIIVQIHFWLITALIDLGFNKKST